MGFARRKCGKCEKFFWTLDSKRQFCPDHENYSFIGKPQTNKHLDYVNAWKETDKLFRANDHTIVTRYPVVCRWREDLYFTIASIVDFQRVVGNQIVFELPANPLVVPQMCLRFNDIENVGLSGRHYTGFCMIGQTCNADAEGGYWKDRCIDLDYGMLTKGLGIKPEEITFVEDVWMGAGAFGYSLEYFVRGLELGNAVFTEFEGNENDYRVMPNKIIDMSAGLERFSSITMGTPTSYDCSFGPVVRKLVDNSGTSESPEILSKYFTAVSTKLDYISGDIHALKSLIAKELKISDDLLTKMTAPYEAIYTIADHTRTLVFAISDGALPSNVGGGYNLRMLLRRTLATIDRFGWNFDLAELVDLHIDYLKSTYPELEETRNDVKTILGVEKDRYIESKVRMKSVASNMKAQNKKLTVDDLIRLYESDGITPDFLKEAQIISEIPQTFYERLSDLHQSEKTEKKEVLNLDGIPDTNLTYYKDDPHEFDAKVLKTINTKLVVLDRTSFYPRGGGQEPDHGKIGVYDVVDVNKHGNIVVHELKGGVPKEGEVVKCKIDSLRRYGITRHHTSTHVLNASARNTLGSWIWQHSAFKEMDHGRL